MDETFELTRLFQKENDLHDENFQVETEVVTEVVTAEDTEIEVETEVVTTDNIDI
jgi:hypothetical protein